MKRDDNERARAGDLGGDHTAGTERMTSPDAAPPPPLVGGYIGEVLARIDRRREKVEAPIPTPWPSFNDQFSGGLWPGLHLLVGGTGTGKTQWALQIAFEAARVHSIPSLYIGLELNQLDIGCRLLALQMRADGRRVIPWSDLHDGRVVGGTEDDAAMRVAAGRLEGLPLRTEFGPADGWPYHRLARSAEAMRRLYPEATDQAGKPVPGSRPLLVVLDFLQLVDAPKDFELMQLRERIGKAAYAGRQIARDFNATVLFVSSTARANYNLETELHRATLTFDQDEQGQPMRVIDFPITLVGMGKESGEIEYSADSVTIAARMPSHVVSSASAKVAASLLGRTGTPRPVVFATAKRRAGREGWTVLDFDRGTLFRDYPAAALEAVAGDVAAWLQLDEKDRMASRATGGAPDEEKPKKKRDTAAAAAGDTSDL